MNLTEYMKFKSLAGGGGSGSSLPSVTAEDNGKVLEVVNGAWAAAQPSSDGVFHLTLTYYDTYYDEENQEKYLRFESDKTFNEIKEAILAGKVIAAVDYDEESETYDCLTMISYFFTDGGSQIGFYKISIDSPESIYRIYYLTTMDLYFHSYEYRVATEFAPIE